MPKEDFAVGVLDKHSWIYRIVSSQSHTLVGLGNRSKLIRRNNTMRELIVRPELRSANARIFENVCKNMLNGASTANSRFRQRSWSVRDREITDSVLALWASTGILGGRQVGDSQWPKFTTHELIWMAILKETGKYGIPLTALNQGQYLFTDCITEPNYSWSYLELAQHLVCLGMPISLMVYPDGHMELYFGNECTFLPEIGIRALLLWVTSESIHTCKLKLDASSTLYAQGLKKLGLDTLHSTPSLGNAMMSYASTLTLNMNHIYSRVFQTSFIPFTKPQTTLNPKENVIIEHIRSKAFEEIAIILDNGSIDRIKTTTICREPEKNLLHLADKMAFGEVIIKKSDGKVQNYKHVESVKL